MFRKITWVFVALIMLLSLAVTSCEEEEEGGTVVEEDTGQVITTVSGMDEERPEWLEEWRQWPGLSAAESNQLRFIPPDLLQRNAPRIIQGAELMCDFVDQARAAARLN